MDRFWSNLPFQPTGDQRQVISELLARLGQGQRLYGLIQGDVGCGKTLVGLAMAWVFSQAGYQTALLCPTTVLAEQHARTAGQLLAGLDVKIACLSSRNGAAESKRITADLESGACTLAVGTHRLFQQGVCYKRLALVMIDEQHRFGVDQRGKLLKKGQSPHYLALSATPIPRSLAWTLHGEFNVWQIREKPRRGSSVRTILKKAENRSEIIRFAKSRIAMDERVFWVFPLIEGDEDEAERSAKRMFSSLATEFGTTVGLVHGKLAASEMEENMARFRRGELRVLVATTVIEVGIDIPEASIMVVESADCFGLSQLHQLRGRVGRGNRDAYCFLVAREKLTRDGLERMRVLEHCDDGFEIAAKDLDRRGAGEWLGRLQSGKSEFNFGDPWRDRGMMRLARDWVRNTDEQL